MIINVADLGPVKIQYLDRLYDHEQSHPGQIMESGPLLLDEMGLSLPAALDLTRALDDLGLVQEHNSMGNPSAHLADAGRDLVARMRAHRENPIVRAAASRTAVLLYVREAALSGNDSPDPDGVIRSRHGEFFGTQLTSAEIQRAVTYLEQKGLVRVPLRNGAGEAVLVQSTARGEDCVEQADGDVVEYFKQQQAAGTVFNTHVGSISGGNGIAVGSSQVTQNVTVGIDASALQRFVSDLLTELDRFGEARPEAQAAIDEIATEAEAPQPNPGRLRTAVGKLLALAKQASMPLVTEYLKFKAQELGILPPASP